jgi:hypothetical protein
MANIFGRQIRDALLSVTRALPTSDGTVTSADIDLGQLHYSPEDVELEVYVPSLNSTQLPSADTLTITVQGGNSATPSSSLGLVKVITGDGSDSVPQRFLFRLPSDCGRYINVKFVAAGGTGDISGSSAVISLLT